MFYGLIEHIKETNANVLKDLLINFVSEFSDIESKISYFEQEIEKNLNRSEKDITTGILNQILHDEITVCDGMIKVLDILEEKIVDSPYHKTATNDASTVISVMLKDCEKRLNEVKSETLKMYYGIKIDTLNEVKKQL